MKSHAVLVGGQSFLRLWSVLGCPCIEVAASDVQALKAIGASAQADVVLYEEDLLVGLSQRQTRYFEEAAKPYWIPLPNAEGGLDDGTQ